MEDLEFNTFTPFPKLYRLFRDIIISEKLDGTNAQVIVSADGTQVRAASRKRFVAPGEDNFGFAAWVGANRADLLQLGPGSHFGEWWGAGIQRRYDLDEKRFSLFNVSRWGDTEPEFPENDNRYVPKATRPACCSVVPVLYQGPFDEGAIRHALNALRECGSVAAPGFMKPEGIVVFHVPSQHLYKYTIGGDGHKGG